MKRRSFIALLGALPAGISQAITIPQSGTTRPDQWSVLIHWNGDTELAEPLHFTSYEGARCIFNLLDNMNSERLDFFILLCNGQAVDIGFGPIPTRDMQEVWGWGVMDR